jgi:hypothetical protein
MDRLPPKADLPLPAPLQTKFALSALEAMHRYAAGVLDDLQRNIVERAFSGHELTDNPADFQGKTGTARQEPDQ